MDHRLGGTGQDFAHCPVAAPDGRVAALGIRNVDTDNADVVLSLFDSSGTYVRSLSIGGGSIDVGQRIFLTQDGGFVFSGHTGSFGLESDDMLIGKCDSAGDCGIGEPYHPTVASRSPTPRGDSASVYHYVPVVESVAPQVQDIVPDILVLFPAAVEHSTPRCRTTRAPSHIRCGPILTPEGKDVVILDASGSQVINDRLLSPGVYFCTLEDGAKRISRKVVLTK